MVVASTMGMALNIINSTIANNSAMGSGGGIFQYAGTVNVTNSTITGNSCNGAGGGSTITMEESLR